MYGHIHLSRHTGTTPAEPLSRFRRLEATMEFREMSEEAAAWAALRAVQARSNAPPRHQPTPLVLLTANGRYSNEEHSSFGKSKVTLAGIVRVAKYFRISEWTAVSKSGIVLEAALKWINQANLQEVDYWHHFYKILRRRCDSHAKEFLLGIVLLVTLYFARLTNQNS
jgi:hypothetical protein